MTAAATKEKGFKFSRAPAQKTRTSQESRITRTVPDHKNPGYQKRIRLRMSPILHPTNFADFALLYKIVCCLAMARQQLATKCIARRLEKVLPHLIERDQTGYIKGRYIGENFCPMSDIIEHHGNKEGVELFLDFDKAFDSLEWDYLFKMLDAMNSGLSFVQPPK